MRLAARRQRPLLVIMLLLAGPSPLVTGEAIGAGVYDHLRRSNAHLAENDPRQWPMKSLVLARDEYTFFRGTADLFYGRVKERHAEFVDARWPRVLLHGDVHIGNVGAYAAGAPPEANIRFGLVDLDEAVEGPFVLDLLRAATSLRFYIPTGAAGESNDGAMLKACADLVAGYRRAITGAAGETDIVQSHTKAASLVKKAAKGDAGKYLKRYIADGSPPRFRAVRVKDGAPADLMEPVSATERERIVHAMAEYYDAGASASTRAAFRFQNGRELAAATLDVARWTRLGSSGSQGMPKYLVLLDRPVRGIDEPLLLQLKGEPVPAAGRVGLIEASSGAKRAADVAKAHANFGDPPEWLVGHTAIGDQGFLVRGKDPWNEELDISDFVKKGTPDELLAPAAILGEVVGLAHRRAILKGESDETVIKDITVRLDGLEAILCDRSRDIADQLRAEHREFVNDPHVKALCDIAKKHIAQVGDIE